MIQLTFTLKMTTAQVVETSVAVNNNSPIQDYVHPHDQTQPTLEMTPGFQPFTFLKKKIKIFANFKIFESKIVNSRFYLTSRFWFFKISAEL